MLTSTRAAAASFVALLLLGLGLAPAAHADGLPLPGLRVLGGAVWHVDPQRDALGALDVLPVITVYQTIDHGPTWGLVTGYGYEGGGTHLFQLGGELGVTPSHLWSGLVGLRGVIGSSEGELGLGMRATVGADFLIGIVHVELGYQLLSVDGDAQHDLRVMAGLDLLRLVLLPLAFGGG